LSAPVVARRRCDGKEAWGEKMSGSEKTDSAMRACSWIVLVFSMICSAAIVLDMIAILRSELIWRFFFASFCLSAWCLFIARWRNDKSAIHISLASLIIIAATFTTAFIMALFSWAEFHS